MIKKYYGSKQPKKMFIFKFSPDMDVNEFIYENRLYYSEKLLENHPQFASDVNDWDFNPLFEYIDKEEVIENMVECYRDYLLIC